LQWLGQIAQSTGLHVSANLSTHSNNQSSFDARADVERNVLAPTIEFLRRHAPFDRMTAAHTEFLAKHLRLGFYAKGEVITAPSRGVARTLYIVKQGRVRGALDSGRTPSDDGLWELEPGECFPVGAMLGHRQVVMKHCAVEDTFCFEIDREDFDKLLSLSPVFRDFCSRRLSSLLAETLRGMQVDAAAQSSDVSFNTALSDLVHRAPVTCARQASISQAVASMHAERVGSIVVVAADAAPLGIFTLHDLLGRVAARNLAFDTPITQVMTPRPLTVAPHASAYEAMTLMARHGIGHLCIVDNGKLTGVVSERDLFSLQRIGLVHLTRSITQASTIETLARLGRDVRRLAEHMLAQGVSVAHLIQLIALLNDHIGRRVIAICVETHGAKTAPFTWLSFGSEGRQEQTLKTDQDNGILFRVPRGRTAESVRAELLPLARRINEALAACGYPLCPGNVMASNPECCLSLEEWQERFGTWIDRGEPEHLLKANIYFDVRVLEGDGEPVEELRRWLLQRAASVPRFQRQMAQNALRNQPPLGLIREFVVEDDGKHANTINLKLRGAAPFVDGARLLALANGISETNTLARLRAVARVGTVRESEVEAWCDAYLFIQMLRMRGHQTQERAKQPLDNYVDPDRLNELDRRVLKEAFRQARKLQSTLSLDYQL
jgi:CBS domain-containing protein